MKRSTDKILTTHVGSLAHPPHLHEMLRARDLGEPFDAETLDAAVQRAVVDTVKHQIDVGIAVVNDGEQGKLGYTDYVRYRLNGFERDETLTSPRGGLEARQFPEFFAGRPPGGTGSEGLAACTGPLSWKDFSEVESDIANLKAAVADAHPEDVFMTSASPGVISSFSPNRYYPSEEAYLYAIADVMKREYQAIVEAGFTIQIDCPELAMDRDRRFSALSLNEFRKIIALHVEVLNYALAGLPPEQLRMHMCWGRPERPHNTDVPLRDIVDLLVKARPSGLCVTGANGRHEHEWKVWKEIKLPDGKVLIPGVIDNTTNIIEHPETVAERIVRYASVVGRENVIAGVDCGFGTSPKGADVNPKVAWAKLASLAEGAALATRELWGR